MSRIRADKLVNRGATGAPTLTYGAQVVTGMGITGAGGINISGVCTAGSFSGPGQSLATYEWKNGSATSKSGAAILSTSRLGFLWEPENNRFSITVILSKTFVS